MEVSKKAYKELQKRLKDSYVKTGNNYHTFGSVGDWVKQSSIAPTRAHTLIICKIFGSVPYTYQKEDRKVILSYLKNTKFKKFKKELI